MVGGVHLTRYSLVRKDSRFNSKSPLFAKPMLDSVLAFEEPGCARPC